jgi:hypothetical protein
MNVTSKETKRLQKEFLASHLKDLQKLKGQCFLNLDVFDDEEDDDEDGGGMESTMVHSVTEDGSFIVTIASVVNNSDSAGDFAEISVNEEVDVINGEPCSKTEFDNVVERAKALIEKKLSELKTEKKDK